MQQCGLPRLALLLDIFRMWGGHASIIWWEVRCSSCRPPSRLRVIWSTPVAAGIFSLNDSIGPHHASTPDAPARTRNHRLSVTTGWIPAVHAVPSPAREMQDPTSPHSNSAARHQLTNGNCPRVLSHYLAAIRSCDFEPEVREVTCCEERDRAKYEECISLRVGARGYGRRESVSYFR